MRQGQKSKQEWQEIIEDFKNSGGKSKRSYCRIKDLKYHSFKYWYYQLKDNNGSDEVEEEKDWGLVRGSEERKIGFTRFEVIGGKGDLLPDNNPGCGEVKTEEQVRIIKLTLRSGIKLELVVSNIFELIRELNYVA